MAAGLDQRGPRRGSPGSTSDSASPMLALDSRRSRRFAARIADRLQAATTKTQAPTQTVRDQNAHDLAADGVAE